MPSPLHTSVLYNEVESIFQSVFTTDAKKIVVDATTWLGWHTALLVSHMGKDDILIACDRDQENLIEAKAYIESTTPKPEIFYQLGSFSELPNTLDTLWFQKINAVLYDLWVSSVHYDSGERGFSFRSDHPLDMRFDRSSGKTAAELINTLDTRELFHIFRDYGEDPKSWQVANAITNHRQEQAIHTTFDLLKILEKVSHDKKTPTRIFQALRIAVNQEFEHIRTSLEWVLQRIEPGWAIMVITFHSLEDRLVKHIFDPYTRDTIDPITWQTVIPAPYKKYTKKPIVPSESEISENPRSRSAKMRVLQKTL